MVENRLQKRAAGISLRRLDRPNYKYQINLLMNS